MANNCEVEIERTAEFYRKANALSDLIFALPISTGENDEMMRMLVSFINEAESTAFKQGFDMGLKFEKAKTCQSPSI